MKRKKIKKKSKEKDNDDKKTKEKEDSKKEKKVSSYKHDSDEDNESSKSKNSKSTIKPKDRKSTSKLSNDSDEEDSRRVKSAPNITGSIKKKDALTKENSVRELLKQSSPGSLGRKSVIAKETKDIMQDSSKLDTKRVTTDVSDKKPQEKKI